MTQDESSTAQTRDHSPGPAERFLARVKGEWEVWLLMAIALLWYLLNIQGSLSDDEVLKAAPGYDMVRGYGWYDHLQFGFLGHFILGAGQVLIGEGSLGARLLVPFFAIGTIYVTYHLGLLVQGRETAVAASLFMAFTRDFAQYSVMAFFDIPVAFFAVLIVYQLLHFQRDLARIEAVGDGGGDEMDNEGSGNAFEPWPSLYIQAALVGVSCVALEAVKYYGVYLGLLPFLYFFFLSRKEKKGWLGLVGKESYFSWFFGAGFVAFVVLFLPFFLAPHPSVDRQLIPDSLLFLYDIPILGNFIYGATYATGDNVGHFATGHKVTVAGQVYQYPPLWTYLYWNIEIFGSLFALVFVVLLVAVGYRLGKRAREKKDSGFLDNTKSWGKLSVSMEVCLFLAIALPLFILSVQSVKFQRYVFLYLPQMLVFVFAYLFREIPPLLEKARDELPEKLWDITLFEEGKATRAAVLLAFALVVAGISLESGAGVNESLWNPDIHVDSGYEEAADYVVLRYDEYVLGLEANGSSVEEEPFVVVSWVAFVLDYYLPDGMVMNLTKLDYQNDTMVSYLEKDLNANKVHLIVDYQGQGRFDDMDIYHQIRDNSRVVREFEVQSFQGSDLLVLQPSGAWG